MRLVTVVLALLLIPLLAVSAGAIYMEGQAPPVDDGQYHILAADSGLSDDAIGDVAPVAVDDVTPVAVDDATPTLYTANSIGKFPTCGIGCNVGRYASGPIVTKVFIPPVSCKSFCPTVNCFVGCNTGCGKIPTGIGNIGGLPQSCYAPIMNVMIPA